MVEKSLTIIDLCKIIILPLLFNRNSYAQMIDLRLSFFISLFKNLRYTMKEQAIRLNPQQSR